MKQITKWFHHDMTENLLNERYSVLSCVLASISMTNILKFHENETYKEVLVRWLWHKFLLHGDTFLLNGVS